MNIKQLRRYLREALTPQAVREQFKPGSVMSKMFIFSLVGAVTLGIIYNFVGGNLVGTRASTDTISVTTAVSKPQVALNEDFTLNVLLAAPAGKKVSQLDLRLNIPVDATTGDVSYTAGGYESAAVGSTQTNYFNTVVLESLTGTGQARKFRLVLSSTKKEAELSDKVLVRVTFKGTQNGKVTFTLDKDVMEIVGPGGVTTEPVSYTIGVGSVTSATVTIGSQVSTPTTGPAPTTPPSIPTPTITIAPPPACLTINTLDRPLSIITHANNVI